MSTVGGFRRRRQVDHPRWLCLTSVRGPAARFQIKNVLHRGWSANFGTPVCQFSVGGNRRTLQNAEWLLQTGSRHSLRAYLWQLSTTNRKFKALVSAAQTRHLTRPLGAWAGDRNSRESSRSDNARLVKGPSQSRYSESTFQRC